MKKKIRPLTRLLLLMLLAAGSLLLPSCGNSEPKYRIGVSQCGHNEWREKMNREILREALIMEEVEVSIRDAHDDSRRQIEDIRQFIAEKIDLLIISPNESEPLSPVVEEAYRAGIPVILFDRKVLTPHYTAYIGADNRQIGRDVGKYIRARLHDRGNILEITGRKSSTPALERQEGTEEVLRESPGIRILARADARWKQEAAERAVDSLLRLYPDVDLIVAHNDRMALGAWKAAHRLRPGQHIRIIGTDAVSGNGNGIDLVAQGILDATFINPTEGDSILHLALDILQKKPFPRETLLSTALIDSSNVRIMQLQTEHIDEQDHKIEYLNQLISSYLSRTTTQQLLLAACLTVLLLLAALLFFITRAYREKNRMNKELFLQKKQLEEQRNRLVDLSKEMEEATHTKLAFFTNVSHDFRTPLTLVLTPVEQLLETPLAPGQRTLLQLIHKNTLILKRLVNQILDFRKYETRQLELNLAPIDLRAHIEEWSEAFRTLALKKHIGFRLDTGSGKEDFWMMADSDKMERIYFNLLSNAFRFTPENGTVSVSLSREGNDIHLCVCDTGTGIAVEHIQHIFEQFYTADAHHAGSGIGLAVVKSFVELHHGHISVESREREGTCFTAVFPASAGRPQVLPETATVPGEAAASMSARIETEEEIAPAPELEQTTALPGEEEQPERETLLTIDDNADMRLLLRSLLGKEYRLIEAADGEEGVKKAMQYVPDLIVCDIMMPRMSGMECCRILKQKAQTSHIPILMLTAYAQEEDRIKGFEMGADSYMEKPFNPHLLQTRVRNLLQNRKKLKEVFCDGAVLPKSDIGRVDKSFLDRFRELVEKNLSNSDLTVEELGAQMGMSRVQLYRKLKALTNYSPNELLRIARLRRAAHLLATTEKTIAEVAYETGFASPSYFTRSYKEYFGENPTDSRSRRK